MPANESTVFQCNIKIGQGHDADLHNIYASNGQEALELLDFFSEHILPKLISLRQQVQAVATVAQAVPLAPPVQQSPQAPPQAVAVPAYQPAQTTAPAHLCEHQQPMRLVPAGVSKTTGKPYGAFYTCAQPRGQQCQARVQA